MAEMRTLVDALLLVVHVTDDHEVDNLHCSAIFLSVNGVMTKCDVHCGATFCIYKQCSNMLEHQNRG